MLSVYLAMVDSEDEKDLVEKLYNTYKKTLFNICLAILCNRPDAEDAVHETFIRIINNSGKIKDVDSPQTKAFLHNHSKKCCHRYTERKTKNSSCYR